MWNLSLYHYMGNIQEPFVLRGVLWGDSRMAKNGGPVIGNLVGLYQKKYDRVQQ